MSHFNAELSYVSEIEVEKKKKRQMMHLECSKELTDQYVSAGVKVVGGEFKDGERNISDHTY